VRIRSVQPIAGFLVRLEFTDGTTREVNLEKYLHGPIFEPLRTNPALFHEVAVDPRAGTIVWPNGADIDPDVLYHDLEPAWSQADADRSATGSGA
jgi:Protein of unknown function (DUF2442)